MSSYTVKAATTLLAVTAVLSNVLGLVRNLIFYRFVPLGLLDIYYVSFRIPDFLFNLIVFGAITSAFIPVVAALMSQDKKKEAWQVTNEVLSWILVTFVGLAVVLALTMEPIIHAMVPGFDATRLETAVFLSRLMLIQTILFALSFTIGGALNSTRRFVSYALAPLVYNVAIIIGALFAPQYGITAVSYAVIIGSLLHLSIQYFELHRTGFRPKLRLKVSPQIQEIIQLMIPRSVSQGVMQLTLIAYTTLASALIVGSISIYNGMNDLQTTPAVIIANSLAVAMYPALSGYITNKDWVGMNIQLTKAIRVALFLLLPTLAMAFILRAQVVRLYMGMGDASWEQTQIAIQTFVWFLVGVVPAALSVILARVFYAMKDTRTPMYSTICACIVSVIVAFVGIRYLGGSVVWLAIAASALSFTQFFYFIIALYKHDHVALDLKQLGKNLLSYSLAASFLGAMSWLSLYVVDIYYRNQNFLGTHVVLGLLLQLVVASLIGILAYLGYSLVVHREELQWLVKKRFTNDR